MDSPPENPERAESQTQCAWPALAAGLRQALTALQQDEGFRPPELLEAREALPDSDWEASPEQAWSLVAAWREHSHTLPPRTQVLIQALHMLLADILLSLSAPQEAGVWSPAQIWNQQTLADRLNLYFQLASRATEARPEAAELGAWPAKQTQPVGEESAQGRAARRWEAELLPMAVGLVLNEARLVVPFELCKQLAQRRLHSVFLREPGLSEQGRRWLERIAEVLPKVLAIVHERFQGIFREVEPLRWEYMKPDPEEVAMIIKARLFSQAPVTAKGPYRVAELAPVDEDDGQQAAERFLKAFRLLVAKGMQEKMSKNLELLEEDLKAEPGQELLALIQGLGVGKEVSLSLRPILGGLKGEKGQEPAEQKPSENGDEENPYKYIIAALQREAVKNGLTMQDMLETMETVFSESGRKGEHGEFLDQLKTGSAGEEMAVKGIAR